MSGHSIFFAALDMSINDCESIDFGVTNKFYQAGEFMNMESVNSEDRLYIYLLVYLCTHTHTHTHTHK